MTPTNPTTTVDLIADNGGGLTLQVVHNDGRRYAHHYTRPEACSEDLQNLLIDGHALDWEGNDADEIWQEYDNEIERNGGYYWYGGAGRDARNVVGELCERINAGDTGAAEMALHDHLCANYQLPAR